MKVVSGYMMILSTHFNYTINPAVILILTVYKRFHDYADFQSSIINVVYHDGMVYMLCIIGAWQSLTPEVLLCNWSRKSYHSRQCYRRRCISGMCACLSDYRGLLIFWRLFAGGLWFNV